MIPLTLVGALRAARSAEIHGTAHSGDEKGILQVNRSRTRTRLVAVVSAAIAACVAAQSSAAIAQPTVRTSTRSAETRWQRQLDAYLAGLRALNGGATRGKHPVGPTSAPTTQGPLKDPTAPSGQSRYSCTTTPYSMTTNPATIVDLNPDASKLWLGGLLQGQGYAQGPGSLRELPIRQRSPLTVYIDTLGKQAAVTVKRPTPATVQQAIGRLVQKQIHSKVPVPTRASYKKTTQSSTDQALLDMNISAKYAGAEADAKLASDDNAQQSTVMAEFYERMFTVSIVKPQVPSGYFNKNFTRASLAEQQKLGRISRTNPPVVISSISYGRILLYSVTSTASAHDLEVALDAAWDGGAASAKIHVSQKNQSILRQATYQVDALGGPETEIKPLLQQHALGDYFRARNNPATAVPISYQVDNLGTDSTAKFSETTNYNLTECTPISNHQVVIGANVRMSDPDAYLAGGPNSADTYGYVNLNDQASWNVSRDHPFTIQRAALTPLLWAPPPDPTVSTTFRDYALYFDPSRGTSTLHLEGSINCKLYFPQIGPDPSNQYNWTWNVNGGAYGEATLNGGSAHCPIQLRTSVTKLSDITEWQP